MTAAAASNLKPVSLELGGKSPLLIFDDADIDEAADIAFRGIFFNKVGDFAFYDKLNLQSKQILAVLTVFIF